MARTNTSSGLNGEGLTTLTNVPTYENEAAAISAGLTTGQVYKSYDGQNYFLAIVH